MNFKDVILQFVDTKQLLWFRYKKERIKTDYQDSVWRGYTQEERAKIDLRKYRSKKLMEQFEQDDGDLEDKAECRKKITVLKN